MELIFITYFDSGNDIGVSNFNNRLINKLNKSRTLKVE